MKISFSATLSSAKVSFTVQYGLGRRFLNSRFEPRIGFGVIGITCRGLALKSARPSKSGHTHDCDASDFPAAIHEINDPAIALKQLFNIEGCNIRMPKLQFEDVWGSIYARTGTLLGFRFRSGLGSRTHTTMYIVFSQIECVLENENFFLDEGASIIPVQQHQRKFTINASATPQPRFAGAPSRLFRITIWFLYVGRAEKAITMSLWRLLKNSPWRENHGSEDRGSRSHGLHRHFTPQGASSLPPCIPCPLPLLAIRHR